jgi:hypothetical protein
MSEGNMTALNGTCLPEKRDVQSPSHAMAHPRGTADGFTRKARACVSVQLALAFIMLALVTPAAALDEPFALSSATASQHHNHRLPIGLFLTLLILIGQHAVTFSGTLVGPLMGIASVLWLMMRNDAAISPKASWM